MNIKSFCLLSGMLFIIVAVVHLARLVLGWPLLIGAMFVPMWVSVVGLIVTGALGVYGLRFGARN